MSIGFYQNGGEEEECEIIGRGRNNVRIKLANEQESQLVPKDTVREWQLDQVCRIVPDLPLARFYGHLRDLTGSPDVKLTAIQKLLGVNRKGANEHNFLSQLFKRSLSQCQFYDNRYFPFHPVDRGDPEADRPFADNLVAHWRENMTMTMTGAGHSYVDRELAPLGTHQSCTEFGEASNYSSRGGMDILLARGLDENVVIPVVGEIKADTETVGPTFALIQSLMYVSQLATESQFYRLRRTYPNMFANLQIDSPRCNILVILQSIEKCHADDLNFAINLAKQVNQICMNIIPSIEFVTPQTEGNILMPIAI